MIVSDSLTKRMHHMNFDFDFPCRFWYFYPAQRVHVHVPLAKHCLSTLVYLIVLGVVMTLQVILCTTNTHICLDAAILVGLAKQKKVMYILK